MFVKTRMTVMKTHVVEVVAITIHALVDVADTMILSFNRKKCVARVAAVTI